MDYGQDPQMCYEETLKSEIESLHAEVERLNELLWGSRSKSVFIVTAYRWGNQEKHSYVIGAYNSFDSAHYAADIEEMWRGGKYKCKITEHILNEISDEKHEYYKNCI
jgi:hypothetical protein